MLSALSPSRASDFMACPMLYRFRVIDKLPSPPTPATARGTLVHAVLERLFDLPAGERTDASAQDEIGARQELTVTVRVQGEDDYLLGLGQPVQSSEGAEASVGGASQDITAIKPVGNLESGDGCDAECRVEA